MYLPSALKMLKCVSHMFVVSALALWWGCCWILHGSGMPSLILSCGGQRGRRGGKGKSAILYFYFLIRLHSLMYFQPRETFWCRSLKCCHQIPYLNAQLCVPLNTEQQRKFRSTAALLVAALGFVCLEHMPAGARSPG